MFFSAARTNKTGTFAAAPQAAKQASAEVMIILEEASAVGSSARVLRAFRMIRPAARLRGSKSNGGI